MCEKCREAEKVATNITPEVEQLLEGLASGVASKIQDALGEKLPAGLPRPLQNIVIAAAVGSLSEAYGKALPREQLDLAARLTVRILATSDRLRAEHDRARGAGPLVGLVDSLRKAGIPVSVETVAAPDPQKGA